VRADAHAITQLDFAFEDAADIDFHIHAHLDFAADVDARGIRQLHALFHQRFGTAAAQNGFQPGQLFLVVDAEQLLLVVTDYRMHRQLALHRVLHANAADLVVGVLLLHDGGHAAGFVPQDAAVAGGILGQETEQADTAGMFPGLGQQMAQGLLADQRHIAVEHQDIIARRDARQRLLHRMARAQLFALLDEIAILPGQGVANLPRLVPDHDHDLLRIEPATGVDDMLQQRLAGERVNHLRAAGFHAAALAGSEDDDTQGHLAISMDWSIA